MTQRLQQQRQALGSQVILTLVGEDTELAGLMVELWSIIENFEARFSRFRATSELSAVNAAAGQSINITRDFHDVISQALEAARLSDNLFNPLILPALQQAGYVASWPTPDDTTALQLDYRDRKIASIADIQLTATTVTLPAGTALDFGGIGKGILLDRLADYLDAKCPNFWLSLGGDLVAQGTDRDARPWELEVAPAYQNQGQDDPVQVITHSTGKRLAIATSGITKRHGHHQGRPWHHLIDPRTGRPAATDLATVTVCVPSATTADVLAKCAVILGSGEAPGFLLSKGADYALLQFLENLPGRKPLTIGEAPS